MQTNINDIYRTKYEKYKTKCDMLLKIIQNGAGTKRKIDYDPCDLVYWIIDIIGTIDILKEIINVVNPNARVDIKERGLSIVTNSQDKWYYNDSRLLANGLLFDTGHWYFFVNGVKNDSYNLRYQIKGTAHFCQTIAMICYMNRIKGINDDFIPNDYEGNVIKCANFWISTIKNDSYIRDFILEEASGYGSPKDIDLITGKEIRRIKQGDLITIFKYIIDNAIAIYSCKEG